MPRFKVKCTLSGYAEVEIDVPEGSSFEDVDDIIHEACAGLSPQAALHEWSLFSGPDALHALCRAEDVRKGVE